MESQKFTTKKLLNIHVRLMKYELDSSLLMDFESRKYEETRITIPPTNQVGVVYIVKKNGRLRTIAGDEEMEPFLEAHPNITPLVRLECNDKGYFISDPGKYDSTHTEDCYAVLSNKLCRKLYGRYETVRPMEHALTEGDRIQFGRMTLVVRYLAHLPMKSMMYLHDLMSEGSEAPSDGGPLPPTTSYQSQAMNTTGTRIICERDLDDKTTAKSSASEGDSDLPESFSCPSGDVGGEHADQSEVSPEQTTCRICLEDESAGPLVVPCKCKGSMKYVHLSCVRRWVQGRLKVNDDHGNPQLSYFLQNLKCELCNVKYPSYVEIGKVVTEFLGIEEPAHPYAVLEPEGTSHMGLHLVSVSKGPVDIGRGSNSVLTLQDISVSRSHANLEYRQGQFYIQDKGSKFGTLLKLSPNYRIAVDKTSPFILKIGTEILCVSAKPASSLSSLCCFSFTSNSVRVSV